MIKLFLTPMPWRALLNGIALATIVLVGGCTTSSSRLVPFAVQSDPLGAHVLYKYTAGQDAGVDTGDWIYLGITPVDLRREVERIAFKRDDAFTLRVLKDGYLEQRKTWGGREIKEQLDSIGKVFWNPRLVPSGQ